MMPPERPQAAAVWLLTADRPGEVAQQRILGAALGLPLRELQVGHLRPWGGSLSLDTAGFAPPWPAAVISFGKTLPAALALRQASGGSVRIIHLGRPRGVHIADLDLVIPMPQDRVRDAGNVLRVRMPFNRLPDAADDLQQRSANWPALPRPCTALIVGGPTLQLRFSVPALTALAQAVSRRARERGGSVLVSTSPRTPPAVVAALRTAIDAPGEFYEFRRDDRRNPLSDFLRRADELIVTGDSASMVAECWRTGKPLWVMPVADTLFHRLRSLARNSLPRALTDHGYVPANVDINRWLRELAAAGHIGLFGRSDPRCAYAPQLDDDLARAVERIRTLLIQ